MDNVKAIIYMTKANTGCSDMKRDMSVDEIEITDEMIRVGVDALKEHLLDLMSPHLGGLYEIVVSDVFLAMSMRAVI
jgi:hypothetical protein